MADWRQITARIRRARSSKDPQGQLANLYEKTSDAMVAFELAKVFENAGQNSDAARWYSRAAERFRRAEWKTKAQEAATRLGGASVESPPDSPTEPAGEFRLTPPVTGSETRELPFERNPEALESSVAISSEIQEAAEQNAGAAQGTERKPRRRGRRGGRNRRRSHAPKDGASHLSTRKETAQQSGMPSAAAPAPVEPVPARMPHVPAISSLPVEAVEEPRGPSIKGRYGDPGLSSRISLLEMQFRRLLACPPAKLSEADRAPAGPGVFVLTDSDLTTYYYVEACQTLRVAVGTLLRGGTSRRGANSIKPRLAEHLGIAESRVAKYLTDHCVVRWLQLDEGASNFAHFVIAVLRPALNE